jgi:hypothetical protein
LNVRYATDRIELRKEASTAADHDSPGLHDPERGSPHIVVTLEGLVYESIKLVIPKYSPPIHGWFFGRV